MTPTPEQVAQWAREAGIEVTVTAIISPFLRRFALRAMAAQAEADAVLCKSEAARALFNWKNDLETNQPYWNGAEQMAANLSNDIRANAPKPTK